MISFLMFSHLSLLNIYYLDITFHGLILYFFLLFLVSISVFCCWLSGRFVQCIFPPFIDIFSFLLSCVKFPRAVLLYSLYFYRIYIFSHLFKMNDIFLKFYSPFMFSVSFVLMLFSSRLEVFWRALIILGLPLIAKNGEQKSYWKCWIHCQDLSTLNFFLG